jgi:mono/diheme cytochrome c family protein
MRFLLPLLACGVLTIAQSSAEKPDGKALFERKCATCHSTETAEKRIGPSLKGVKEGRLPDPIGKEATHDNILKQIDAGGGGMPVFRDLLTKDQKEAIIAYVLTL